MSVFPKTRTAAGYIAGAGPGELARARATILLARLGACEDILPGSEGDVAALHGRLRDLVLAVRELAGPAWLDASSDDPDVAAFTVLEAAASPPDPARTDEICSRVLWARFAPGTGRDDPGHGGTGPGQIATRTSGHLSQKITPWLAGSGSPINRPRSVSADALSISACCRSRRARARFTAASCG